MLKYAYIRNYLRKYTHAIQEDAHMTVSTKDKLVDRRKTKWFGELTALAFAGFIIITGFIVKLMMTVVMDDTVNQKDANTALMIYLAFAAFFGYATVLSFTKFLELLLSDKHE